LPAKTLVLSVLIILLCTLALAWHLLSPDAWFTTDNVSAFSLHLRENPFALLYVIALYTLGGLIAFPVVILIPATAMVFGPLRGCLYSLCGLVANASVLYALGHVLGHETINHYAGMRVKQISHRLAQHGFLTVALLRLFPVAPFTLINLISGASPITFRTYTFATVTGISPALIFMTLAGAQLKNTLYSPVPKNLIVWLLIGIILLTMGTWLKRKVLKRTYRG
jgi:uncharacterized membrane protein YdjX (TVP38/TMEM64 family)